MSPIRFGFGCLFSLASIASPAFAQESDPQIFDPASDWALEYADNYCLLQRTFESEQGGVILQMRQFTPGASVQLLVISDSLRSHDAGPKAGFIPFAMQEGRDPYALKLQNDSEAVALTVRYPGPTGGNEASNTAPAPQRLQVDGAFSIPIVLDTGDLQPVMEAMSSCMNDLLATWGVDSEDMHSGTRPARPVDQARWMRRVMENYPREALRSNDEARLHINLLVGPDGTAEQCSATNRVGYEQFEESACAAFLEHARFEPALDAQGNPTHGFWYTGVNYTIDSSFVP